VFSNKVGNAIQELLADNGFQIYYIDQIPSYDQAKNLDGFVGWDVEETRPMHSTEGVEYADDQIVLNFDLAITVYGSKLSIRNSIEKLILDTLQPASSGKRIPLRSHQLTNAFIRYMVWVNTTEFPIPKTGQSNAEMSASVLLFNSSISVLE
jgi:hypothetical protein